MKTAISVKCELVRLVSILDKTVSIIPCGEVANVIKLLLRYFYIPKNFYFCLSQFFMYGK